MRKLTIVVGTLALIATSGMAAADGYARRKAPAPVYADTWSGWYTGVHAGYSWGTSDASIVPDATAAAIFAANPAAFARSLSTDPDGFIGGALAGFNVQSGSFVWGIETDISIASIEGSASFTGLSAGGATVVSTTESKLDWLSTLRARAGLLVTPTTLVYVTGGLAYGHVEHSWAVNIPGVQTIWSGNTSGVEVGWTAGGGAEFAFSRKMTIRGEYLYYDLGDTDYLAPGVSPNLGNLNVTAENKGHIARAALVYKFGGDCCERPFK